MSEQISVIRIIRQFHTPRRFSVSPGIRQEKQVGYFGLIDAKRLILVVIIRFLCDNGPANPAGLMFECGVPGFEVDGHEEVDCLHIIVLL